MNVFLTIAPVEIVTRKTIEKEKPLFQPVTNTVFPNAEVAASLSSIYVPRNQSPVTTDYIIPIVDIVGLELREFVGLVGHIY